MKVSLQVHQRKKKRSLLSIKDMTRKGRTLHEEIYECKKCKFKVTVWRPLRMRGIGHKKHMYCPNCESEEKDQFSRVE